MVHNIYDDNGVNLSGMPLELIAQYWCNKSRILEKICVINKWGGELNCDLGEAEDICQFCGSLRPISKMAPEVGGWLCDDFFPYHEKKLLELQDKLR